MTWIFENNETKFVKLTEYIFALFAHVSKFSAEIFNNNNNNFFLTYMPTSTSINKDNEHHVKIHDDRTMYLD